MKTMPNTLLEANGRCAPPPGAEQLFRRLVHAQTCVLGGARSATRYALSLDVHDDHEGETR